MTHFKLLDICLQVFIIITTVVAAILPGDKMLALFLCIVIFYGGMGAWQLISALVHLLNRHERPVLKNARLLYLILLPFTLGICLYPIATGDIFYPVYAMGVGLAMAVYYFIITVIESIEARKMEAG